MNCTNCGKLLSASDVFCSDCGTPVPPASDVAKYKACPSCGYNMRTTAKFCIMCGSKAPAEAVSPMIPEAPVAPDVSVTPVAPVAPTIPAASVVEETRPTIIGTAVGKSAAPSAPVAPAAPASDSDWFSSPGDL